MPQDKFEFRIPLSRLLTGVILTIVPICAVGLFTMTRAERAIDTKIGGQFQTIAVLTASEVASFFTDRVIAVGTLAADPVVVDTVQRANAAYVGANSDLISGRIGRIEKEWNTPAADAKVRDVLGNSASRLLTRWRDRDRRFLRITLTDRAGAVVAATHKTLDYFQADEDFWQAISAQGRGAVNITDVRYDDVTKSYYLGLGAPVMDEATNTFIGALDALIEVSSIFPLLHRVDVGPTSRALLVKDDGTVIHSPFANLSMNLKSEEFVAAHEAMARKAAGNKGYAVTTLPGGEAVVIGYADIGMRESFPSLAWTVLLVQDTTEAFASTRGVMRMILFVVLVGLIAVTLLSVYFLLHRRAEYTHLAAPAPEPERPTRTTV